MRHICKWRLDFKQGMGLLEATQSAAGKRQVPATYVCGGLLGSIWNVGQQHSTIDNILNLLSLGRHVME